MAREIAVLAPMLCTAGALTLFVGAQAAIVGWMGHRARMCSSFAGTCVIAAGFIFATAALQASATPHDAVTASRWQLAFGLLFMPAFVLFIGRYSGVRPARLRRVLSLVLPAATVLLAANAMLPDGIRYQRFSAQAPLRLPWGEVIPVFGGVPTGWALAARLLALAVFAWAAWRALALRRAGQDRRALMLFAYLVLQVGALVHALLIDYGIIRAVYLPGFAFLALALIMSASLAMELREQSESLRRRSGELRAEMSRRTEAERELRDSACRDELTGLPNRACLHGLLAARLAEARAKGRRGILLLLDLDHFRTINDALGPEVGDQVLVELAAILDRPYADPAVLVRLGGDEFALVLSRLLDPAIARAQAERFVAEVARRLETPVSLGFQVGASFGVAYIDADCEGERDLLRCAGMALHEAKASRGQPAFYEPGMRQRALLRMRLMRGLRGARERGELSLVFQPQCDSTGALRGAEALMRWTHPGHGPVPPAQFIALAEESGLIHSLGRWALDSACAALAGWKRDGLSLGGRLAVNISGWQLAHPDFVGMVRETLDAHGVAPAELALEITETVLLVDCADSLAKLSHLRALGLSVSMDDFGTGFSSLAQLHRVPLDEIKIDKSFVDEMLRTQRVKLLVETIVAAGHHLQLAVVAEGVETREQHAVLAAAGCDLFQGYLYGPPLPEAAFRRRLGGATRASGRIVRKAEPRSGGPPIPALA